MNRSFLQGKQILLTRAEHQLESVSKLVRAAGATAIPFPCLELEPIDDQLDQSLEQIDLYTDILFTSVNGVQTLQQYGIRKDIDFSALFKHKRIAAVGHHTSSALSAIGISVDIIPETASQQGLIEAYRTMGVPERLLFFRAEEGSEQLETTLSQQGVIVKTVKAYRTTCPGGDSAETIARLRSGDIDAVLLGSSKTARHFLQRVGSTAVANRAILVAISDDMASESKKLGLNVQVVAKTASFEAMLNALSNHYSKISS